MPKILAASSRLAVSASTVRSSAKSGSKSLRLDPGPEGTFPGGVYWISFAQAEEVAEEVAERLDAEGEGVAARLRYVT